VGGAARFEPRTALKAELGVQLLFYDRRRPRSARRRSDPALLRALGPGVLWVAALLASLLRCRACSRWISPMARSEQMALSPYPLPALISGKIAAHWLATGLPWWRPRRCWDCSSASGRRAHRAGPRPVAGNADFVVDGRRRRSVDAGLRNGALLALLVLPLYVPVLIFGAGAVDAVRTGLGATAELSLLAAALMASLVGATLAAAAAVRMALD
jgi:heme exporter protein B